MPCLQVDETCQLYAALQLPRGTTRQQASERIDTVLASMGMHSKKGQMVSQSWARKRNPKPGP